MFIKLFEPISIGSMELKNRVIMGPMGSAMADEHHYPTEKQIRYYAARAKGGVSLVMVEHTGMQLMGSRGATATGIWDREGLPQWKKVTAAIKENGARAGIQIGHQGACTDYPRLMGGVNVAASAVRCYLIQEEVHSITLEEMVQFKKDYVNAVQIAIEAGFDTVMIHLTNGYFLASWLSGRTNKRTDRYGGTLENRLRFPFELITEIRRAVGPDFPLMARLATREVNGGRSLEETRIVARELQKAGIDGIDLNSGSWSEYDWEFPSYFQPEGFLLHDAEQIKQAVSIPIISGGRIIEPLMAEQALEEERCDIVSVTRGMLADPQWLHKAQRGETESIRRCIGCNRCINDREHGLICSVNPFQQHEEEWTIRPTDAPKKIGIIGAGPAGLQAATVAAQRGHDVTVIEREEMPGGMIRAAGVPPLKWNILALIPALVYDAEHAGAKILYNTEATTAWVKAQGFDHVIVATGARPVILSIPNDGSLTPITATDVLLGEEWVGQKVAIIGGGMIGCETAEFLGKYQRKVTIFEMLAHAGNDIYPAMREKTMAALREVETTIITEAKVTEFKDGYVCYQKDGQDWREGPFDSLLFSVGMRSDNALANTLLENGMEPIVIGDAIKSCRLHEALSSAVEAVINL